MKIIEKTITLENKDKPLILIPMGDIHLGSVGCNKTYLKNTIEWIKNKPNCYVIGMGDFCDCITIKDDRFDIKSIDPEFIPQLDNLPFAQVEYLKDLLIPIKDKILCCIPGNHEDKFRVKNSVNVMNELFKLGIEIGDYMTFLRIKFDRNQFHTTPLTFFLQHGWFSGRKVGGKINQLIDVSTTYDADVYIVGHSHYLGAELLEKVSIGATGKNIFKCKKVFINSGSFVETISLNGISYSEKKAYPNSKVGVARIDIYPKTHPRPDIHIRI